MSAIESRRQQIEHADQEMHSLLDRFEQLATTKRIRRPFELDYYKWEEARPDLVHPTVIAALRFVFQVEIPSDLYAKPILEAADKDSVTSLRRFIERTWLPEERQHGVVLGQAAIIYGAVSQEEHARDFIEIPKLDFSIGRGYTAGMVTTYGETQELVTKLFYEAMRNNTQDPVLIAVLTDHEAQEMFHNRIYGEFRRRIATPQDVIQAIREFQMPGYITSPELQQQSPVWTRELGFDSNTMKHNLAVGIIEQAGYQGLGRVVTSELIRKEFPLPIRTVLSAADRIQNPKLDYLVGSISAKIAGVKDKAA